MSPFTLGWIDVPSFTALMALALGAGLLLTWWQARRFDLAPSGVLDAAFVGVLMGVIGARAAYVVEHWDYYQLHRDYIAAVWQGGLAWHGGLIGGALGAAIACRWRKLSTRRVFDALTPGLMAGAVLGWLAAYLAGVAYGREVFPGDRWWFLAADLPDIYGQWNPRFATQLMGAAWAGVCLLVAVIRVSGIGYRRFPATLALYSAGMFLLGFTRGDASLMVGGWRFDQVMDAAIVIVAVVYIARPASRRNQISGRR